MDFGKIEKILTDEPKFRKKQVKQLVFCDLIESWNEATTLPESLRKMLNEKCPLEIKAQNIISQDRTTIKALITLKDGLKIESVLMRHESRNTVCVSSQVGCPLDCVFCATGQMGFKRNLDKWEIVEQVLFFARYLKNLPSSQDGRITNIVFMGMGEPFLNYENVIGAIRILNDKEGFNLGARHFSISTVGITEGIQKLAEEKLEVNLAISLHAPNNGLRSKMMPVNKKYSIEKILSAVEEYIKETRRRVMFEYIMIKDINDSDDCARELAELAKRKLFFVNLIAYNPTGIYKRSAPSRIKKFRQILENEGVAVTQRWRFGQNIKAACGQLAARSLKSQ